MITKPDSLYIPAPKGFIVFEGVNGAGKSTLIRRVADECARRRKKYISTLEPGSTALGRQLRQILLESESGRPAPLPELLLFSADRAEHVERIIKPALAEGTIVLCDRYFYSTIAFQGYGRGIERRHIDAATEVAIQGIIPDLVLLLDIDPAEGLRRTAARRDATGGDSFEAEELAFHRRIRDGFHQVAAERPEPFVILDASAPPDAVFAAAWDAVERVVPGLESA